MNCQLRRCVRVMVVCLSVTKRVAIIIIRSLRTKNEVSQGSLLHSKCMYYVDFTDSKLDFIKCCCAIIIYSKLVDPQRMHCRGNF